MRINRGNKSKKLDFFLNLDYRGHACEMLFFSQDLVSCKVCVCEMWAKCLVYSSYSRLLFETWEGPSLSTAGSCAERH